MGDRADTVDHRRIVPAMPMKDLAVVQNGGKRWRQQGAAAIDLGWASEPLRTKRRHADVLRPALRYEISHADELQLTLRYEHENLRRSAS